MLQIQPIILHLRLIFSSYSLSCGRESLYMQKSKLNLGTNPNYLLLNVESIHLLQGGGEEL